jgi:hypothetical protein
MKRFWMIGGVALLALALLPAGASAQRFGFGARFGGPGFYGPRFFGPSLYFGAGPGFYPYPGWYGYGYYGLGYYEPYGYVPGPVAGKVKFDTKIKNAQVYVDGAFAGNASQLGTFVLKAGAHDLELRDAAGQPVYTQHVDVIAGKTLKIKA